MFRNVRSGDMATSGRQFVTGAEATAQAVRARLRLFLGEWFLDVTRGTNWFGAVLGKAPQDVAEIELKNQILSTPGVAQIRRFVFDPDLVNRRLFIRMTLINEDGTEVPVELDEAII